MSSPDPTYNATEIIFENFRFSDLTHAFILANGAAMPDTGADRFFSVQPEMIELNAGTFSNPGGGLVSRWYGFGTAKQRWRLGALVIMATTNFAITRHKCYIISWSGQTCAFFLIPHCGIKT
jgi:hypothetical protein